jgi:3-dehydroquinate synthase
MRVVKVPLGNRSYSILIGSNGLIQLGKECRRLELAPQCAVISDENVAPRYGELALRSLQSAGFRPVLITVSSGEKTKSLRTVRFCYEQMAAHRLERKSFVVALGGGVVGDLAGFVAATYLRGIPFVQVPTTLLAQVDSSVGGKVGVNLKVGKNLVGAFHQPRLVICDLQTLRSVPEREYRAGLAEVIKYGIICDPRFFNSLEQKLPKLLGRDSSTLASVIVRCCAIKAEVVGQDETESDRRAILNFGHTIGHALEALSGYGRLLHGEAIAIGQTGAAQISSEMIGLPARDATRITQLLARSGLPTRIRLNVRQKAQLLKAMELDKKVSDGQVKFVLAKRIGEVVTGQTVPRGLIERIMS